jgi:aspartate kinase
VDNIALIGVVASDLSKKPKIISTLFGVLGTLGIGVKMIDLGSNDINITIGIDNEDYEYAIKGIYNAYN